MAAVPVEVIPAEGLQGTHISHHLTRFHLKIPSLELHLRFVHRVKSRVKLIQKTFVYGLIIYLKISRVIGEKETPVLNVVKF